VAKKKRSEEQKTLISPIVVVLGGEEISIPVLRMRASREWREAFSKSVAELPGSVKLTDAGDTEELGNALKTLLITMPEKCVESFFLYARTLKREAFEETATDEEVAAAFDQIIEVAFPLGKSLLRAIERIGK